MVMTASEKTVAATVGALGQYSLVSYCHPLRGERVNIGVLVWHPWLGRQWRFAKNLQRVRSIDENADLDRLRRDLDAIQETLDSWDRIDHSPLAVLASEFRYSLVVNQPLGVRVQDPAFTLERFFGMLVAPEPFMRASSTVQFTRALVSQLGGLAKTAGAQDIRVNYVEEETFQPVRVAVSYRSESAMVLWRAVSFASVAGFEQQVTVAKACYADNADLKTLPKYKDAKLAMAVQVPKPADRADFPRALDWLHRDTDLVEVFESRDSIPQKLPQLLNPGGAKILSSVGA